MGTGIANARSVQWGQSTPATQALASVLSRGRATSAGRRRRKSAKKTRARTKKKRASAKRGRTVKARMVKGSAAARRHMAKLRRMRKRR